MNQVWFQQSGSTVEPAHGATQPLAGPSGPQADGRSRRALDPRLRSSGTAPVLLSAVRCDGKTETDLQPRTALRFVRHPLDSSSGICEVAIFLSNRSEHVAHRPFFCLTDLGLQLRPAANWLMDEVVSIRRMRRFAPIDHPCELPRGAELECCAIGLLLTSDERGRIEYEAGNWHDFDALPDLRVNCVVGAGNFPSERLLVTVPAVALKAFVADLVSRGDLPRSLLPETAHAPQ